MVQFSFCKLIHGLFISRRSSAFISFTVLEKIVEAPGNVSKALGSTFVEE